jgi:hypothetical protein
VEIYAYNDHRSAPFFELVGWLSTANSTRTWEPTLSWNQLHSLTRQKAKKKRRLV